MKIVKHTIADLSDMIHLYLADKVINHIKSVIPHGMILLVR
jgi:hypothetical protein